MRKYIEILEKYISAASIDFKEKYSDILEHEGVKTAKEQILYNDAGMAEDELRIWNKKLKKMIAGKQMPSNVLKKIENLPLK